MIDRQRQKAKARLQEIAQELSTLSAEASALIKENFEEAHSKAEAYKVCMFGDSVNPYDTTFVKIVEELETEFDDEDNGGIFDDLDYDDQVREIHAQTEDTDFFDQYEDEY